LRPGRPENVFVVAAISETIRFSNLREVTMYLANDRELSVRMDSSQTSAAKSPAKWMKVAICAALAGVFVYAALAAEIELIHSGVPVTQVSES
jgi:hypothetical protein